MSYLGFCPPGVILPYIGTTAPDGWLLCDGQEISQATYAALFEIIGTSHNTQVNPTTGAAWVAPAAGNFRLPDYRGSFLRGVGSPYAGDAVTLGGWQAQKTAKNGLAASASSVNVSGLKNQMNGGTGGVNQNHYHGTGDAGGHSHYVCPGNFGGDDFNLIDGTYQERVQMADAPQNEIDIYADWVGNHNHGNTGYISHDHGHSWDFGGSAQFTAAGTAVAQAIAGDNETRPHNKGVNYIIKI